jgi:hypothetical protein
MADRLGNHCGADVGAGSGRIIDEETAKRSK